MLKVMVISILLATPVIGFFGDLKFRGRNVKEPSDFFDDDEL